MLKKSQILSIQKRRLCMKRLMDVNEARETRKDSTKWEYVVPTFLGNKCEDNLGANAPPYCRFRRWHGDFKCAKISTKDDPHSGRPTTVAIEEMVKKKSKKNILADRHVTIISTLELLSRALFVPNKGKRLRNEIRKKQRGKLAKYASAHSSATAMAAIQEASKFLRILYIYPTLPLVLRSVETGSLLKKTSEVRLFKEVRSMRGVATVAYYNDPWIYRSFKEVIGKKTNKLPYWKVIRLAPFNVPSSRPFESVGASQLRFPIHTGRERDHDRELCHFGRRDGEVECAARKKSLFKAFGNRDLGGGSRLPYKRHQRADPCEMIFGNFRCYRPTDENGPY
ncbi:hypothetical protein EVAR_78900_1 [Eumeta japonica]|uniref:Uncharacterized protein n=1 Tax=Eumeta variegata TaxID=151549 RepID=A0A4C1U2C3_EUMVA|nr:hypothetical protein EVAR_78900_1 [Eumeta japonica]